MDVIVIGDLGKRIPNLPKDELGQLIQEMRDPASEDPQRTLIRHFAGDIAHDITTRLGEPINRGLTIPDDLTSFSIKMKYPETTLQKTVGRDLQDFINERKQYWVKQYEDGIRNRARANGIVVIEKALST
jgi:hypothetical protein